MNTALRLTVKQQYKETYGAVRAVEQGRFTSAFTDEQPIYRAALISLVGSKTTFSGWSNLHRFKRWTDKALMIRLGREGVKWGDPRIPLLVNANDLKYIRDKGETK